MTKPSDPSRSGVFPIGPLRNDGAARCAKSALMAVDEVNQSDDFDFTFTPHLRDPGGVVAAYHTACDDLIREEQVEHIIGCYTSASRKQVIPDRRAHRPPALAPCPLRGFRVQRQRDLCRRRAQPHRGAAGAAHARPHRNRRVLHRLQLCLDLGDQPGDARDRDRRRRPHPRRTAARARRDRGRSHRQRDRRSKAAGRLQHAGRRIQLRLHARAARGLGARGAVDTDAELQPVRAGAEADRPGGLGRLHHLVGLFREHRYCRKPRLRGAMEGASRRRQQPVSVDGQSTYVCVMLLARAIRRAGSAEVGAVRAPPPIIATIRRKGRSGSIPTTIIAS